MLEPRQRARLAGAAHKLDPLASLGRAGLTEAFAARLDTLLSHHELVKLRFQDFKERKRELSAELAERTRSELVALIGNVAVFYRPAEDPEKRKYEAGEGGGERPVPRKGGL